MMKKQTIRYAVDLGMTALLPLLMAYSLVGEAAHEWLGTAMLALFIGHHCLNRTWLKNLPRGRYSGFRILQTALAALILLTVLGTMVSGMATSRHVLGFLLDYLCVMGLFICAGCYFGKMLQKAGRNPG